MPKVLAKTLVCRAQCYNVITNKYGFGRIKTTFTAQINSSHIYQHIAIVYPTQIMKYTI